MLLLPFISITVLIIIFWLIDILYLLIGDIGVLSQLSLRKKNHISQSRVKRVAVRDLLYRAIFKMDNNVL